MTPFSEEELRRRVEALPWTNQNIQLTPNVWTVPGKPPVLQDPRLLCVKRAVREALGGTLAGARVADLGCLEGGMSLAFALEGADVLGVEGRAGNVEKCRLVQEHFGLPNLAFEHDDARNFRPEKYGMFDAVLVCGLLYHLDTPVEFVRQAARCARRVIVIETHFAPEGDAAVEALDTMPFFDLDWNPLMERVQVTDGSDVYEGRWWREYPDEMPHDERERLYWASLDNPRSLWLTRRSIYRLLANCGFDAVGERLDFLAEPDDIGRHMIEKSRGVFVGVKAGEPHGGETRTVRAGSQAALRRFMLVARTRGWRAAVRSALNGEF